MMLTCVLGLLALLFAWAWWQTALMWNKEYKERRLLEKQLKHEQPDIDIPKMVSLAENPLAYLMATRLQESNKREEVAVKVIEGLTIKLQNKELDEAKTATCLANFGDIPEKFDNGSQLHRYIREAVAKARQEAKATA